MKTLRCSDAGFDCEGELQAETEEEILSQAQAHALEAHNVEVTPEMAAQIQTLIRDDAAA